MLFRSVVVDAHVTPGPERADLVDDLIGHLHLECAQRVVEGEDSAAALGDALSAWISSADTCSQMDNQITPSSLVPFSQEG